MFKFMKSKYFEKLALNEKWLSKRHASAKKRRSTIPSEHVPINRASFRDNGYLLLTIPAATFALGTWQVQRRKWKLGLIRQLEERTTAPPIPLPDSLNSLDELEYRRVCLRGSFDHSQELYVMPRSPVHYDEKGGGLISGKSQTGAYVITAFKLAGSGERVMVNRGWVPRKNVNPTTRQQGQVEGEFELVAVVRKSEKRPPFGGKNQPEINHWSHKNSEEMAGVLHTLPLMFDADRDSTVPGGPLGGQTRVTLRNEHFSYIITWYSLSLLTFLAWYKQYWLRR